MGRVVKQINVNKESNLLISSDKLHGLYIIKMIGNKVTTQQLVIQ